MDRLSRDERAGVVAAFEKKYDTENDPNVELVCMRYSVYDGDYLDVKVHKVMGCNYPHIFNNCNVFVEKGSRY